MCETLREQLVGAWRLLRYVERPVDGAPAREPLGPDPQGLILYTPDGYMSAQLSAPGRQPFTSGDWFVATPQEFEAEASTYIAYSGPWEIGQEPGTIMHGMDVSLFPNWGGQRQLRKVSLEGDRLILSSCQPVRSGGTLIDAELEWHRASSHSGSSWPPRGPGEQATPLESKMSNKYPHITMDALRAYPRVELTEAQKRSRFARFFERPLADIDPQSLEVLNSGPCNPQLAMPIENRSDLFLPGEQSVEVGYCAMPDGTGFVANRTFFPDATPEMIDWWMNFHPLEGIRLAMWLPNAHVDSYVKDPYLHSDASGLSLSTRNWNREHYPTEGLTSLGESGVCCIRFYSPQEFGLDMHKVLVSPVKTHSSASVLFFGDSLAMFGEETAAELRRKDPNAKVPFNTLLHTIRPVVGGCEMRSRFWIGKGMQNGIPYNVTMPGETDVEAVAWVMLRHTLQEMSNLASFLPEVYNMCGGEIPLPE